MLNDKTALFLLPPSRNRPEFQNSPTIDLICNLQFRTKIWKQNNWYIYYYHVSVLKSFSTPSYIIVSYYVCVLLLYFISLIQSKIEVDRRRTKKKHVSWFSFYLLLIDEGLSMGIGLRDVLTPRCWDMSGCWVPICTAQHATLTTISTSRTFLSNLRT